MIDLKEYGYTNFYENQITHEEKLMGLLPARIISIQKETYKLISINGENNGKLKGSLFYQDAKYKTYPAVGDFVLIKPNASGDDIIYRVFERKSCFSRLNPSMREQISGVSEQIVAANFDYVFIMASLNYDFNVRRIERYLSAAWQSGGTPIIVLTKADLCEDITDKVNELELVAPGIDIHVISAHTGFGMEGLNKYLKAATTLVFMGSSGIGKSSLINALANMELMKVSGIREDDSKGHHTTTYRQLFKLDNGVLMIDTPGMRELGVWDVTDGLSETFYDIEELASKCKFHDCSHQKEPGCAIRAAIEEGTLTIERLKSYEKLQKEAKYNARKAAIIKKNSTIKHKRQKINYQLEES